MASAIPSAARNLLARGFTVGKAGLLLAGLLAARPIVTQAQQATPAAAPTLAAPDTLAAIHRLYAAKRKKLLPIVTGTVAADVVGIALIGATVDGGGYVDGRVIGQGLTGLLGLVVVGTEVLFYTSVYGKQREARAVAAFEAHQLPRHLRRQLKPRYFQ